MPERITINRQMIEETFDGAAPLYDKGRMFRESGQRLVDLLPIISGNTILDIATGTGAVLLPAARCVGSEGHVTGIDISNNMLQQAKRAATKEGLINFDLRRMDAERLEFPDASFDVVTCAFGIFYFPRTALAEMYRICKPGGVIGLAVFEKWSPNPSSPSVVVNQLITEYREKDPDATFSLFKYDWPTRFSIEEVELLLTTYGFHNVKTIRETNNTIYADGEEFWEMLLSGGSRLTITNMSESTKIRFKKDLLDRLKTIMQEDGIHFTDTALYSVAQR